MIYFSGRGGTSVIGSAHADTLSGSAVLANHLNGNGGLDTITGSNLGDIIAVRGEWAKVDGEGAGETLIVRDDGTGATLRPDEGTMIGIERIVVGVHASLDLSLQSEFEGTIRVISRVGDGSVIVGSDLANGIFGGAGDDVLTGGSGRDTLRGGGGADTFVFTSGDEPMRFPALSRSSLLPWLDA